MNKKMSKEEVLLLLIEKIVKDKTFTPEKLYDFEKVLYLQNKEHIKEIINLEKFRLAPEKRNLLVFYHGGITGIGKSYLIHHFFKRAEYHNVLDYQDIFSGYNTQKLILFEEMDFKNFDLNKLKAYFDIFQFQPHSRFRNPKGIFYEIVIINSNEPFLKNMEGLFGGKGFIEPDNPHYVDYQALKRRFSRIEYFYTQKAFETYIRETFLPLILEKNYALLKGKRVNDFLEKTAKKEEKTAKSKKKRQKEPTDTNQELTEAELDDLLPF